MPPLGLMCAKIEDEVLPNTRPIDFSPSPRRHRSHISALSPVVKKRRFRRSPITLHLPLKGKVLRRPFEITSKSGRSGWAYPTLSGLLAAIVIVASRA